MLRSNVCMPKPALALLAAAARLLCDAPDDLLHLLGLLPPALRRRPCGAQIVPRFDWRVHNLNALRFACRSALPWHFERWTLLAPNAEWACADSTVCAGCRAAQAIDAKADNRHGLKGLTALLCLLWALLRIALSLPCGVRRCDPVPKFGRICAPLVPKPFKREFGPTNASARFCRRSKA